MRAAWSYAEEVLLVGLVLIGLAIAVAVRLAVPFYGPILRGETKLDKD